MLKESTALVKVRVAIILFKDDKILLVRHRKHQQNYWVLPGGTVEWGETLEKAAKREIKEETNLEIALGEPVFIDEALPRDGHQHVVDLYFRGKILAGDLRVRREKVLREARFFSLRDFEELNFYPRIKEELKDSWEKGFPGKVKYLGNRWR
jgi:8-oxo-dGTP diphosphatase